MLLRLFLHFCCCSQGGDTFGHGCLLWPVIFRVWNHVVSTFVSSRVHYWNVLLFGLLSASTESLQMVQNDATRILICARKFDPITPMLASLHWLSTSLSMVWPHSSHIHMYQKCFVTVIWINCDFVLYTQSILLHRVEKRNESCSLFMLHEHRT